MKSINLLFVCMFSLVLFGCTKGCSSDHKALDAAVESEQLDESMDSHEDDIDEAEEKDVSIESPVDEDSFIEDDTEEADSIDESVADELDEELKNERPEDDGAEGFPEDDPE